MNQAIVPKLIQDYLKEVDYGNLEKYIPTEFSLQYLNFIKIISTDMDMNNSPPVHYKMIDGICGKRKFLANLCSRGLAKTTLFAECLFLFLAVNRHIPNFGEVDTAMYIADSMENGAKSLRKNLEERYEKSDILKELLPKRKFTDAYIEFTNAQGKKFGIRLYGSKSGIRGGKIFGNRPKLAVLDDLVSDEDANSPTSLQKIEDTVLKGVIPALDPNRRKVIWCGTPFNKNDPLYKAIESGGWHANVYPVCEKFPVPIEEFKSAWVDRFNYDSVLESYNIAVGSGDVKSFRQEMMLQIASEEDRVIQDNDIRWFNTFEVLSKKQNYNFYITSDFATSTQRKADYTVLGVWAIDSEGNRFLVDGYIGRQTMDVTFNQIFELVQKYNPISVGIEATGQQGGFISLIREEMIRRNIWFNIAKGKDNTGQREGIAVKANKMERFRLTVPKFKAGKVFLPIDMKESILIQEFLEEIAFATIDGLKSKNDDVIDMASQLDQMYITIPDKANDLKANVSHRDDPYFNESLSDDDYMTNDYLA